MYYPLSKCPWDVSYEELTCFLKQKNAEGIVNDTTPHPQIEYDLEDLKSVWGKISATLNNSR